MKIFAISDLHLPGRQDKPMDIFGDNWKNHWEKIKKNWIELISSEDIVLIPGDISWAMKMDEALVDLDQIAALPGRKVLVKGNHDYWWSSITRLRESTHPSIYAIQNDSLKFEEISDVAFCGTRSWTPPGAKDYTSHDEKIFNRELNRLKLSLDDAKDCSNIIVLLHFPPFDERGQESEICHLIKQYPVQHVVFGHLHGDSLKGVIEGQINGITYHLVSCDYLDFKPKLILEI